MDGEYILEAQKLIREADGQALEVQNYAVE
jgi:hypothetical protein